MKKRTTGILLTICMILSLVSIPSEAATKKKVALSNKSVTMEVGQKKTLKLKNYKRISKKAIKKVKWTSSNSKVVAVKHSGKYRQGGKLTAKKKGTSYIKVKYGGKTYKCKVTVKEKSVSTTESNTTEKNNEKSTEQEKTTESNTMQEQTTEYIPTENPTTEDTSSQPSTTEKSTEQEASTESSTETPSTTEDTTERDPANLNDWPDSYNLGNFVLTSAENDYEYDEYKENEDHFSYTRQFKSATTGNRIEENTMSAVDEEKYQLSVAFNIDVKHQYTKVDSNGHAFVKNSGKYWIYNTPRVLTITKSGEHPNDELYEQYIGDIQLSAINLSSGKRIENAIALVANCKTVGKNTYITFPEGYAYELHLPDSLYIQTIEYKENVGYNTRKYKDLVYNFIVGNIEDVKKLDAPKTLAIAADNKHLVGRDINNDFKQDIEVVAYDIHTDITKDLFSNAYNTLKYSSKHNASYNLKDAHEVGKGAAYSNDKYNSSEKQFIIPQFNYCGECFADEPTLVHSNGPQYLDFTEKKNIEPGDLMTSIPNTLNYLMVDQFGYYYHFTYEREVK